jgi:hypothetical protein
LPFNDSAPIADWMQLPKIPLPNNWEISAIDDVGARL